MSQNIELADPLYIEEPDFSNLDPSCRDGFQIVYDKEVPIEVRLQQDDSETPQDIGTLEALRCRIAVQGSGSTPTAVKLELTSEVDLFFNFTHILDERTFKSVREEQKLMVDFNDYPSILARSLNQAIKEPQSFLAVFVMNNEGAGRLDIIQNLEYKFVELLSVSFVRSSDEIIRQSIAFRYTTLKSRLSIVAARLTDVTNVVKLKNPSLLLQLQQSKAVHPNPPTN